MTTATKGEQLNADDLDAVYDRLLGTCDSLQSALGYFGLDEVDEETVLNQLLGCTLEQCQRCGWWTESCEMAQGYDSPTCLLCSEDIEASNED